MLLGIGVVQGDKGGCQVAAGRAEGEEAVLTKLEGSLGQQTAIGRLHKLFYGILRVLQPLEGMQKMLSLGIG